MPWSILHRMIFGELVKVFLLSLVGITGILLLAGIVAEATQQGLGPAQVLMIIPLLIPSTLPYTIPATTLFATCLVYGRLSHDNEILAIKAAGINVLKVVWPGVLLGILMSLVTMGLYYRLIPYTQARLRQAVLQDVQEFLYAMLKRDNRIRHAQLPYEIYVKRVQGRKLIDPVFKRKDERGHFDIVAEAREADLRVDLARGELQIRMLNGVVAGEGGTAYFEDRIFAVPLPKDLLDKRPRKPRELTWQEILRRLEALRKEDERLAAARAQAASRALMSQAPPNLKNHLNNLHNQRQIIRQEMRLLIIEQNMRPALACGCLCFVLVGCPVGIWFSRSDYLSAFITCFLPILFVYYPLLLCGNNLAKAGSLPPAVALWIPNAAIGLIALPLYWRLLKH
ncbi:MAG TPA: LptF/LptG family permease [Gemmataceae bacterium]|nr:LptF/LptG family permease [Gemmataceae bacterium]